MKKWLKYLLEVLMVITVFGAGMLCGRLGQREEVSESESEQQAEDTTSDEYENYADHFYAHIINVSSGDGYFLLTVESVERNSYVWNGQYVFSVDENTKVTWKGKEIDKTLLREGDFVRITSHPENGIMESYPVIFTLPPLEVQYLGYENYSGEPGPLDPWLK